VAEKRNLFRRLESFALDHDVNEAREAQHRVNEQCPDFAEGAYNLGILYTARSAWTKLSPPINML